MLPVKHNLFDGRHGLALALQWLMVCTSPRLLTYLALERLRFAPRAGRRIVVTSTMLYGVMCRAYPRCKPNLHVITPGVTLPVRPADSAANKTRARRLLGLPLEARLVAFVANDYWKKGLPTLLAALVALPADCQLAVVGSPAQIAEFRVIAQGLGVESRVHFLGAFNDVSPLYDAADCLAHPTTEDTFAMVVLEAMAHGLPVVVSDVRYCGIAGKLTHEVNALILTSPTDVAELSSQLLRCLNGAGVPSPLSAGARQLAQRFIWERLAAQQNRIYLEDERTRKATRGSSVAVTRHIAPVGSPAPDMSPMGFSDDMSSRARGDGAGPVARHSGESLFRQHFWSPDGRLNFPHLWSVGFRHARQPNSASYSFGDRF